MRRWRSSAACWRGGAYWRLMDEIAHADFVERTITHDSDVAIDEAPFDLVPRVECRV